MKDYGSRWVGAQIWHGVYGRGRVIARIMNSPLLVVQFDSGEMRELDPHTFTDWDAS